jgi:hypothetical protein
MDFGFRYGFYGSDDYQVWLNIVGLKTHSGWIDS